VLLESTRMSSWDRGFDAEGRQVWGATGGAYVFNKRRSF
jgi:CpeT protein